MKIASARRSRSAYSRFTSPRMRTPRPGPGNGWRYTMSCGRPSATPSSRTSSLNSSRSGSSSFRPSVSGRPPTLWWLLIVVAFLVLAPPRLDHVGVDRALRQPLGRLAASSPRAWNTSTNSRPMILRLASGSLTPARWPRNCSLASTCDHLRMQAAGEHLHHHARLRPGAAGRGRRRRRSAGRRSRGGSAPRRRSNRRRPTGRGSPPRRRPARGCAPPPRRCSRPSPSRAWRRRSRARSARAAPGPAACA